MLAVESGKAKVELVCEEAQPQLAELRPAHMLVFHEGGRVTLCPAEVSAVRPQPLVKPPSNGPPLSAEDDDAVDFFDE